MVCWCILTLRIWCFKINAFFDILFNEMSKHPLSTWLLNNIFFFTFKDLKIECYRNYCDVTNRHPVYDSLTPIAKSPLWWKKSFFGIFWKFGHFLFIIVKKQQQTNQNKQKQRFFFLKNQKWKPIEVIYFFSFRFFLSFLPSYPYLLLMVAF